MSTNKFSFLAGLSLMFGALCAVTALGEVAQPEAYQRLTAVEMPPAHAPGLRNGFSYLNGEERRYGERLPLSSVQLEGAIKKVKAAKYKPHSRAKLRPGKAKRKSLRS